MDRLPRIGCWDSSAAPFARKVSTGSVNYSEVEKGGLQLTGQVATSLY
jgi:hypothetical protein